VRPTAAGVSCSGTREIIRFGRHVDLIGAASPPGSPACRSRASPMITIVAGSLSHLAIKLSS
jgi:hypothetical protein